jgi:hypothetical protein
MVMDFDEHATEAMDQELRQLGMDISPGEFATSRAWEWW